MFGTHVYHIERTAVVFIMDANKAGDLTVDDMHGRSSGQASGQGL